MLSGCVLFLWYGGHRSRCCLWTGLLCCCPDWSQTHCDWPGTAVCRDEGQHEPLDVENQQDTNVHLQICSFKTKPSATHRPNAVLDICLFGLKHNRKAIRNADNGPDLIFLCWLLQNSLFCCNQSVCSGQQSKWKTLLTLKWIKKQYYWYKVSYLQATAPTHPFNLGYGCYSNISGYVLMWLQWCQECVQEGSM